MLKRLSPLDLFLAVFVLMYYGRLSVVLFIPQYAIDYHIPAPYYSLHFAMVSVGCAVSNIIAIVLLRHVSPKKLFIGIGALSAAYEVLLYLYPTPWSLLVSGLLIGLAAGTFWSLAFLMICELIDAHRLSTTDAFSRYNVISTIMAAITPLIAGIIVQQTGYGFWLLSGLAFLIASTAIIFFLKDPIYEKTYGQYPIREDLGSILHNKRSLVTFLLTMLFMTLTVSTWSSISRVFFANVGIRNVWLGLLSLVVSLVTIAVFWALARYRPGSRRVIATLGIVIFGIEMLLLVFVSSPLLVFLLEGVVGCAGIAAVSFATQNIIKDTFRERTYIGRPIFAFGMYVGNAAWFAVSGYVISSFGGYGAIGSILGVSVDQFGLRVFLLITAALTAAWALSMWKYDGQMVRDRAVSKKAVSDGVVSAGAASDAAVSAGATEALNRETVNRSGISENHRDTETQVRAS
ncbi:MAG: Major Facilitator Superfamily protein [Methanocella sp. PtaU1.Bin125]|nr:MAG: Major Facilitator Superfamily protein [Methanocella sp. PtaU1.Bin125]